MILGIVVAKEFLVERDKIPLVLDSTENIVFYAQFSITIFLAVKYYIEFFIHINYTKSLGT